MKRLLAFFPLFVLATAMIQSAPKWLFSYQSIKGHYAIYGGSLSDPQPPTKKERRIAFWIDGRAAKQLFDAMGPDLRNACGADGEYRLRQRAELSCSYHPRDGHHCDFGFDLLTGRSIGGSLC
ncbi:hypothetical protein [Janthinobacterium sp. LB3P118]|uniref:hypothetical protein n=1 Tax=Janthinobacterium sp. LB3P118 TaxID=3424195 RepID=UPI003F24D1DE